MTGYHYGLGAPKSFAVKSSECEALGGHCWVPSNVTLTSNPPQYPEYCKHCGATRVGMEQERYRYSEVTPRRDE